MHHVYILRSQKDSQFYIGYTTDLKKRFFRHNAGLVLSTKPRRPLVLIFYEAYLSSFDAKRREQYLKTTKGKSALRIMLQDTFERT